MEHYIKRTERYLRDYNKMRAESKSLAADMRGYEILLAGESIAGVRYGDMPPGGKSELTATEAAADRRIRTRERIERMRHKKAAIDTLIEKIDCAFSCLTEEDENIIQRRYIEGRSWKAVGRICGYTERGARKRSRKALHMAADILFPMEAETGQIPLLFV